VIPETTLETTLETVSLPYSAPEKPIRVNSSPRLTTPFRRRLPRFIRAKRSHRPPLALQERDLDLLRTAYEYRLISTPQYLFLYSDESRDASGRVGRGWPARRGGPGRWRGRAAGRHSGGRRGHRDRAEQLRAGSLPQSWLRGSFECSRKHLGVTQDLSGVGPLPPQSPGAVISEGACRPNPPASGSWRAPQLPRVQRDRRGGRPWRSRRYGE
jgi:hypothetical protein